MARNGTLRQVHRVTSMVFVATVVATMISFALPAAATWVVYTPLPPLLVLLATGVVLFVQPYRTRRRAGGAPAEA